MLGSFAVGREAETITVHNGVNPIENKPTWKLFLGFECKPNHSLSFNLSLNVHHGHNVVDSVSLLTGQR